MTRQRDSGCHDNVTTRHLYPRQVTPGRVLVVVGPLPAWGRCDGVRGHMLTLEGASDSQARDHVPWQPLATGSRES